MARTLKELLAEQFFFVDESGDTTFYNKDGRCIVGELGCSKVLILGFIRTTNPELLRSSLLKLSESLAEDPYFSKVPSFQSSLRCFHAKDDIPEIREKVFRTILTLDFKAEFFVARKIESLFQKRHGGKESVFYDDLIVKLFENKLHGAKRNVIYFAKRGNRGRQEPLNQALQTAKLTFENKWKTSIDSEFDVFAQSPVGEPCLQVVDYMNWAVQRAFVKGDDRYLNFVLDKVSYLVDIYDFSKYPKNFYHRNNPFHINKISPL